MLSAEEQSAFEAFLSDVERRDNQPVIHCPYGVKKEEIDGKIVLVAMTREEQQAFFVEVFADEPDTLKLLNSSTGFCSWDGSFGCFLANGCLRCAWRDNSRASSCYCVA